MRSISRGRPFRGIVTVLLFSRETIGDTFLRHIGIYGYRAGFIRRYVNWEASPLENIEMLEQLRVLWYGEKIPASLLRRKFRTGG